MNQTEKGLKSAQLSDKNTSFGLMNSTACLFNENTCQPIDVTILQDTKENINNKVKNNRENFNTTEKTKTLKIFMEQSCLNFTSKDESEYNNKTSKEFSDESPKTLSESTNIILPPPKTKPNNCKSNEELGLFDPFNEDHVQKLIQEMKDFEERIPSFFDEDDYEEVQVDEQEVTKVIEKFKNGVFKKSTNDREDFLFLDKDQKPLEGFVQVNIFEQARNFVDQLHDKSQIPNSDETDREFFRSIDNFDEFFYKNFNKTDDTIDSTDSDTFSVHNDSISVTELKTLAQNVKDKFPDIDFSF